MMTRNDDDRDKYCKAENTSCCCCFCCEISRRKTNGSGRRRRTRTRTIRETSTTAPLLLLLPTPPPPLSSSSSSSITNNDNGGHDDDDGRYLLNYNHESSSAHIICYRNSRIRTIFVVELEGTICSKGESTTATTTSAVNSDNYNYNDNELATQREKLHYHPHHHQDCNRKSMMDRKTTRRWTENRRLLRRHGKRSIDLSKTTTSFLTSIGFFIALLFLSTTVATASPPSSDAANNSSQNPYRVLGLDPPPSSTGTRFASSHSSQTVTDTDVKKAFRKLALQYHPDKYHQLPQNERLHAEQKFKQIQHAYTQIKDEESRRQYDFESRYYGSSNNSGTSSGSGNTSSNTRWNPASSSSPYGNDPVSEAFFRAFEQGGFYGRGRSYTGFRMPFPTSSSSSSSGGGGGGQFFSRTATPMMPAELSFKSIYVQKVVMPLQDLYCGVPKYEFDLRDNIWTRYRAAFRGKIWLLSFYQGMMYSLPVLRIAGSKIFALIVGLFIFHGTLPRPDPSRHYESTIRKGLKGGSSIKFTSTTFGIPDVVFEIVEEHHPIFKRVDNDLHTTVWIYEDEARTGCTKQLPSISDEYDHVSVVIPPNVYNYEPLQQSISSLPKNGKKKTKKTKPIRVPGAGWPILNGTHRDGSAGRHKYRYGDLIVTVQVRKGNSPYRKQKKTSPSSNKGNRRNRKKKSNSNSSTTHNSKASWWRRPWGMGSKG